MPPRRSPPAAVSADRLMKRVEERIDQSFARMLDELEKVKIEVRAGNMETEVLKRFVADVERQVIETRAYVQISEREGVKNAEAEAVAAATAAHAAPKRVWRTWLGLITAGSAAFVAIVAFFNNLPKFVRGAAEIAVSLYGYVVRHK